MDFFQVRLRGIRVRFLLRFIKKIQLVIAVRVFFAGRAKPLPLGKRQAVREYCVQKFQFLFLFFQNPDLCVLILQPFFLSLQRFSLPLMVLLHEF